MIPLGPGVVVDVVVVVPGGGDPDLEELVVGLLQQGRGGHETAAGVAVDADAVDVDEGVPRGELLDGRLLVLETVVPHVEVAVGAVGLGAGGGAAAVSHLDDDETELGQLLAAARGGERVGHPLCLRSGVHVDDQGVLLCGIEVEGLPHVAVEIRDPVRRLDLERRGRSPAHLRDAGDVGLSEGHDLLSVLIAEDGSVGQVHPGVGVHDVAPGLGHARAMGPVAGVEEREPGAVEADPVQVLVVDVLSRLPSVGAEPEQPLLLVHFDDAAGAEPARRDGVLELAVQPIQVVVAPAGPLGPPDQLAAIFQVADALSGLVGVVEALRDEGAEVAGVRVDDPVLEVAAEAVPSNRPQFP